jgi:oligosaccharide repeat unit polymerase
VNELAIFGYVVGGIGFIAAGLSRGNWSFEGVVSRGSALLGFVYGVLWMLLPPLLLFNGEYWFSKDGYHPETVFKGFLAYAVFGVAALASAMVVERKPVPVSELPFPEPVRDLKATLIGVGVLALGAFASLAGLLKQMISAGGYAQFLLKRNELGVGSGLIQTGLTWFPIIAVILVVLSLTDRSGRSRALLIWSIVFLLLAVAVGGSTGSRTRMLQPVLLYVTSLMVVQAPRGIPRSLKLGVPIGLTVLLAIGMLLGVIREQLAGGNRVQLEVAKSVSVEVYQEFENGWWLIENQRFWEPLDGATIVAGFVFPVPRAIWPDKPVGSGALMVNLVRPRSIIAGIPTSRSPVTTGLPPESFLNFGWLGFPTVGLVYGLLVGAMTSFRNRSKTPLGVALWAVLMIRVLDCLNMEFFGWSAAMLMSSVPLLILIFVDRFIDGWQKSSVQAPAQPTG